MYCQTSSASRPTDEIVPPVPMTATRATLRRHRDHGDLHVALRPAQHHDVARALAEEGLADGRCDAYASRRHVDLVGPDDLVRDRLTARVLDRDARAERHAALRRRRLEH